MPPFLFSERKENVGCQKKRDIIFGAGGLEWYDASLGLKNFLSKRNTEMLVTCETLSRFSKQKEIHSGPTNLPSLSF